MRAHNEIDAVTAYQRRVRLQIAGGPGFGDVRKLVVIIFRGVSVAGKMLQGAHDARGMEAVDEGARIGNDYFGIGRKGTPEFRDRRIAGSVNIDNRREVDVETSGGKFHADLRIKIERFGWAHPSRNIERFRNAPAAVSWGQPLDKAAFVADGKAEAGPRSLETCDQFLE